MGNRSSKQTAVVDRPAKVDASSFNFPTPGHTRLEVLKNIEFVRQDIEGWHSSVTDREDMPWPFSYHVAWLVRFWSILENIVTERNAADVQKILQNGQKYISIYSRGAPISNEADCKKLRVRLLLSEVEYCGGILALQKGQWKGDERTRLRLAKLAWNNMTFLRKSPHAGPLKEVPWCGGVITGPVKGPKVWNNAELNWYNGNASIGQPVESDETGRELLLSVAEYWISEPAFRLFLTGRFVHNS